MTTSLEKIHDKIKTIRNRLDREETRPPRIVLPTMPQTRAAAANFVRAKTQEAAQTDLLISVKLLDSDGNETGDAFDVTYEAADNLTKLSEGFPLIATSKVVKISKLDDTWYLISPAPGLMDIC